MIKVIWPGRTKNPELRRLVQEYSTRIRQLVPFELIETRDARGLKEKSIHRIKSMEAAYIEKQVEDDYLVCLSDRGREMTSEEFCRWLGRHLETNSRPMTFIIGGFAGLDDRLLELADELLSLSRLTLNHELSRVVLLEQVYRSLTLMKGRPYAK